MLQTQFFAYFNDFECNFRVATIMLAVAATDIPCSSPSAHALTCFARSSFNNFTQKHGEMTEKQWLSPVIYLIEYFYDFN